ncbi:MAG: hypothetical protein R2747_03095 [Pyrinomonadaceae bacterium]
MKGIKIFTLLFIGLAFSAFFLIRSDRFHAGKSNAGTGSEIVVNFDTRQVSSSVWYGIATGDVSGNITLEAFENPPEIFRGTSSCKTRWHIVAGGNSFVAEMNGKINSYNGVLIMRGIVISGANVGETATAEGRVTAINPHRFEGTIRVNQL